MITISRNSIFRSSLYQGLSALCTTTGNGVLLALINIWGIIIAAATAWCSGFFISTCALKNFNVVRNHGWPVLFSKICCHVFLEKYWPPIPIHGWEISRKQGKMNWHRKKNMFLKMLFKTSTSKKYVSYSSVSAKVMLILKKLPILAPK